MEVKGYKTTLLKSTQYKKLVPIALQFTNFDKDWRLKKETKVYSRFLILKKIRKNILLPDYMVGVGKTHKPTQTTQINTDLQKDTL